MSVLVGVSAGRFVRFAPLIAGKAPVNLDAVSVDILASATVPVKFAAGKLVSDAPEPLNVVAVKVPFDELNVRLVPVLGDTFPDAAVANKTLQEVSDDSSAAVTETAVVAVATILLLKYEVP